MTACVCLRETLNAVKERNNLEGHAVEDVIWGNVTQVMEQGRLSWHALLCWPPIWMNVSPALRSTAFCASGMEAVNLAANQVKGGAGMAYIAGGVEMMGACRHGQRRRRDCR